MRPSRVSAKVQTIPIKAKVSRKKGGKSGGHALAAKRRLARVPFQR
jgi:hypothetical protein